MAEFPLYHLEFIVWEKQIRVVHSVVHFLCMVMIKKQSPFIELISLVVSEMKLFLI